MTLRRRTLSLVALTLAGLLVVLAFTARGLVTRGFTQLEEDEARRNLQRAIDAMGDDLSQLATSVEDYGAWDRMVDFIEGRGRDLLISEFVPLTLENLRVHGIVVLGPDGRPLFTYGLDPATKQPAQVPPELLDELKRPDSPLLRHPDPSVSATGILPAGPAPLFVASHAIVTSEGRGPVRGTVVFARYLTAGGLQRLAAVTHLSMRVRQVADPAAAADLAARHTSVVELASRGLVVPLDQQRVAAYGTVRSLHGRPALVVRIDMPRSIVQQGRVTFRYLVVALVAVGLGIAGVMFLVLEWSVLAPLSRLHAAVRRVAASGDLTVPMPVEGAGEFASLGRTMNQMLTALERSERDLRSAREEALAASRAKSEFLANMSHEIRTPMNGVSGMVDLLLRTPLTAEQRRYAETIRTSGEALLQLLNDVLDLSKVEAGKLSLSPTPTDLVAVAEQAAEVFGARARAKGLNLAVRRAPGFPAFVTTDAARVRQIVLNLVGNAVKFTDRGFVSIELSAESTDDAPVGNEQADMAGRRVRVTIAVRDTGRGIDRSQHERVFEKFTQVETGEYRSGGTGLGLTISRQLAVLLGGDIELESEPGTGSTFRVVFPAAVAEAPHAAEGTAGAGQEVPRGLRVLLAEDNPVNQQVGRLMLEAMGCVVDVAEDGEAAVRKAEASGYDLVLMDCRMPRLDGHRATAAIRALGGSWSQVPIVAVTADLREGEADRCRQSGMTAVITKPLHWNELQEALRACAQPASSTPPRHAGPVEQDEADLDPDALAKLAGLRRPSGPDPVSQVTDMFLEDAAKHLERLAQSAASQDAAELREAAHALKGSCGVVGALRLRRVCQELEDAARRADITTARRLQAEAAEAFGRVEPLLRARSTGAADQGDAGRQTPAIQ